MRRRLGTFFASRDGKHLHADHRNAKSHRAIRLLGFSLGGFLASLIAENLYQSGRTVSFLGLIDSNPGWIDASEKSRQELAVRLTQVFTKFQNVGMMRMKPIEDVRRDVKVLVDTCFAQGQLSLIHI